MNVLETVASQCASTLWAVSVQVAVLIGLVWLVSLLSRKFSPSFRYWLWSIVLIRLCLPINLALPFGVVNYVRDAVEISVASILAESDAVSVPGGSLEESGFAAEPSAPPAETQHAGMALESHRPSEPGTIPLSLEPATQTHHIQPVRLATKIGLTWTLLVLGLSGLVCLATIRAHKLILSCPEVTRADLRALVERLCGTLGIRRPVRIRALVSPRGAGGPIVSGILRPTILLPSRMVEEWDLNELEPVLLHELAHVKRLDLLVNWFQTATQILYFFHPLVWYANWRLRQEREMICDDMAIVHIGTRRKRYSRSVLRVIQETRKVPLFAAAGIGLTERHRSLARRIVRIMSDTYRIRPRMTASSTALILVTACVGIALASEKKELKPASDTQEGKLVEEQEAVITSYGLNVNAFPEDHRLKVKATVTLSAPMAEARPLRFELRPELEVGRIAQAGELLRFTRVDDVVVVKPKAVPEPLVWEYEGVFAPPYQDDSMEAVIVYPDEIRLTKTSHWYPVLESSVQNSIRPSSSIEVEVPEGFVVVSGDRQQYPPKRKDGRVVYGYTSKTGGSLSFCAAEYRSVSIPWGEKSVQAYFFRQKAGEKPSLTARNLKIPQNEEGILQTLQVARQILDFYSATFGQYPWPRFALVQKNRYAAYAYGVQTYVVMNDLTDAYERNLAHEIAHQWWGNLIHPVGEGERWLTESLAEYSAFLYMEHARGTKEVVGDSRAFLLNQMRDCTPIRQASFNSMDYENVIYHIGPHVFHMLRYVIGDREFFAAMKSFTEQYAGRKATADDFIKMAETVHGKPLAWFFDQWLDRTKNAEYVLDYEVTKRPDDTHSVQGRIVQHNTGYRMPLKLDIIGQDRKETKLISVAGSETPFEYELDYQPSQVEFAEEMQYWVLAGFFASEEERLTAEKERPPLQPRRTPEELLEELREKVVIEQAYQLGTDIELVLALDQAARLACADNPYGLEEILICPMRGVLYQYRLWDGGRTSIQGVSLSRSGAFSIPGPTPCIACLAKWEEEEGKVVVRYRVETDPDKVFLELRQRLEEHGLSSEEIERVIEGHKRSSGLANNPQNAETAHSAAPAGAPEVRQTISKNDPTSWVYFESKESGEGQAPRLVLSLNTGDREIPVSKDTVLISYLAENAWGFHRRLSISMNDSNRVLMGFDLPSIDSGERLQKAELVLDMKNSKLRVVEPFDLAVHLITEDWSEERTSWLTQPAVSSQAASVAMIEPTPGTVRIDVTGIVKQWLEGSVANHGILLKAGSPFYGPPPIDTSNPMSKYTVEEVQQSDVDTLFKEMTHGKIGYQHFSGLWALIAKAHMSEAATRDAIIDKATRFAEDRTRYPYERWLCCFVLSGIGDEASVPVLTQILLEDPDQSVREGAAGALGEFGTEAAVEALEQAAKEERSPRVLAVIHKALAGEFRKEQHKREYTGTRPKREQPGTEKYTDEQIRQTSAEVFFDRIAQPEPGYHHFSGLWALIEKGKTGDAATKEQIVNRAIEIIQDRARAPFHQRWQCCYVLSGIGDERGVPVLAQTLLEDPDEIVRSVAACALGHFLTPEATVALQKAAKQEDSERVLDEIRKALAGEYKKPETDSPASGAQTREAPDITFPYAEKHVEKLPWPHQAPGLSKEEVEKLNRQVWVINDYSLYQADEEGNSRYFHGGLDIVLDNGTKIYAMKDGWVKTIRSSIVVIADAEDNTPSYGWEYTHLGNIQVKAGDFVRKGTLIGEVNFHGLPHIHLAKVFSEGDYWQTWHYVGMPNAHFTYIDEEPPVIKKPFYFFENNSETMFETGASGDVVLSGDVDIVVGMREAGLYARSKQNGFGDRLGVARIDYGISAVPASKSAKHRFNSFDFRKIMIKKGYDTRQYNTELTKIAYKHWSLFESKRSNWNKVFSYYVITNCSGQESPDELQFHDEDYCWRTAARDERGRAVFPDGEYDVTVTAYDFAGNKSTEIMRVTVENGLS